jgi:hypothetical protein
MAQSIFTFRIATLSIALGVALAQPATAAPKSLSLVRAFEGRTVATGVFSSDIAGVKRAFRATLDGSLSGGVLTVVERFTFADGKRDRKTWRFTPTGPGRWSGTREDVIGTADVVEDGAVIRLSYIATVETSAGPLPVAFSDIIYRGKSGTLINTATVSALGIPVGSVALTIKR